MVQARPGTADGAERERRSGFHNVAAVRQRDRTGVGPNHRQAGRVFHQHPVAAAGRPRERDAEVQQLGASARHVLRLLRQRRRPPGQRVRAQVRRENGGGDAGVQGRRGQAEPRAVPEMRTPPVSDGRLLGVSVQTPHQHVSPSLRHVRHGHGRQR